MEKVFRDYSFGKSAEYGKQLTVETPINTAERGGVSRVLSVEAETKTAGVELVAGEANVSGKVNFKVLYVDAAGKLCGLDYNKDFEMKIIGEEVVADAEWREKLSVMDCGYRLQGDTVEVSAVVDVALIVYKDVKKRGLASVEGSEMLTTSVESDRLLGKKECVYDLVAEEEVGCIVKKVLLFDATSYLTEAGGGEARATVVYLTEEDEIREKAFALSFGGEKGDIRAAYDVAVKNARVVISGDENVSAIEVEIGVAVTAYEYERENAEVIKDVFLPENVSSLVRETADGECFIEETLYKETLSGSVVLADSPVEVLITRPVGLAVAGMEADNDKIKVEGVASFAVIYRAEEEYMSGQGELPFVYELPFADVAEGDFVRVRPKVIGVKGRSTGEISAEIALAVDVYRGASLSIASDLILGPARVDDGAGISVYFAEAGEDVWKIASDMGVAPSALIRANPFLAEPLVEPKKVLIFRAK